MDNYEYKQIKVGKHKIGIIGLTTVLTEMAEEYAQKSDDTVMTELLKRLSPKNYIAKQSEELYGKAFLREFKKFIGKPFDEKESDEGITIKILGPGCSRCENMEKEVIEVLTDMNLAADVEHVRDIKEIGKYGVMSMPGLVINGKVVSVGIVPQKAKIKDWLKET